MGNSLQAKWIWKKGNGKKDEYVRFYDTFHTVGSNATLKISADSNYEVYLNGKLAGFGQYADYPYHKVYDEIDLAPFLERGVNTLEILAWYIGESGTFTYYPADPGLYYEVRCGKTVVAASTENTLCALDACYTSYTQKKITQQLGYGYRYDARGLALSFPRVRAVSATQRDLFPRPVQKLVLTGRTDGKPIDAKKRLYDIGKECAGYLELKFKAARGAVVTVAYGEHILDGEVRQIIGNRDFSVTLVGSGEWVEFANYMRRLGCRYLQVKCDAPVEIEYIGINEALYPLDPLPYKASNALRQRIYDTSVRTLRLCMHEHYEDCPWREQGLYALDSRFQMLYGYHAFGEYAFPRACIKLLALEKHPDGHIAICSPTGTKFCIPFFSLAYCLEMCEYAQYSKDMSLFSEDYGRVKGIIDLLNARESEDDLVVSYYGDADYWNFYEWSDDLAGRCGEPDDRRVELALNAFFAFVLKKVAEVAEVLGKADDAAAFRTRADALNAAINRRFYREAEGLYINHDTGKFSELGNALCVLSGAADEEKARKIGKRITEGSVEVKATLSMHAFVYDALLCIDSGYADYILNKIDTVFGHMLSAGATSFWETELGAEDFEGAGSLCHGWAAMAVYYYRILQN